MKITLVTLSGRAEIAHEWLAQKYPTANIVDLPRTILEEGKMPERLKNLRRERPDIFAVMTESIGWQFGKDALLYFGALASAGQSVIVDARGEMIVETRASLLASAPFRIGNSFLRGRAAIRDAKRRLDRLEKTPPATFELPEEKSIKVAYFRTTPSAGTVPGGATSHINGVVKGLIELGAEVEMVANDRIAGFDQNSPTFHRLSPDLQVMPRAAFDVANGSRFSDRAVKLVGDLDPSFIYERYSRFSIAGVEASSKINKPLFLEYNGSEVWVGRHWDATAKLDLLERYEDLNLKRATRIFVISEVEKNNLLERGVGEEKIIVNPNGVDAEKFRPGVGGDDERDKLGIKVDEKLAGFLGTFGPWHGVLTLADAIALTPKSTNLKFLFVGDGSLRSKVENKLHESDDLDRVIFAGSVSHERVPALLDACDILVSPHVPLADGSDFFGSPTKLFEYMAMGKGIVASRLGQIGDVLGDNETALLVEPGSAQQLSDAIQKLAKDPDLLKHLGNASRQAAIERHTWRINAQRVIEEFENLH